MDLLWLDVKRHYNTELKQPSDIYYGRKKTDKRTGDQILDDLENGLGGE